MTWQKVSSNFVAYPYNDEQPSTNSVTFSVNCVIFISRYLQTIFGGMISLFYYFSIKKSRCRCSPVWELVMI